MLLVQSHGSLTFPYTGAAQSFVVPSGITSITIDAAGGAGGDEFAVGNTLPKGARVEATLVVTPGETLQIRRSVERSPVMCK
jgi:hypothetical protein